MACKIALRCRTYGNRCGGDKLFYVDAHIASNYSLLREYRRRFNTDPLTPVES